MYNSSNAHRHGVVGIDLGGTVVRGGWFDLRGELLAVEELPLHAQEGVAAGLSRLRELIHSLCQKSGAGSLVAIGVGATGPVDPAQGVINNPYTLPGWDHVPITAELQRHFGVPVALENDADVAARGEYWKGAGQGVERLYAVTVGTGIGTAFILNGEIYRGVDGAHPEGGHHVIDPSGPACYCGAHGCWEVMAAGPAIVRYAHEALASAQDSALLALADGDLSRLTARDVAQAARDGDALARAVMDKAAAYFSLGLVNIVALFLPQVIVLSGGVMKSLDLFLPAVTQALADHQAMYPARKVRILPAALGYYAGVYGAAYTALQMSNHRREAIASPV